MLYTLAGCKKALVRVRVTIGFRILPNMFLSSIKKDEHKNILI